MTFVRKSGKYSRQYTLASVTRTSLSLAISLASIIVLIRTIVYYVLSCAAPCGVSVLRGANTEFGIHRFLSSLLVHPPAGPLSTAKAILRSSITSKNILLLYFTGMQIPLPQSSIT
jgi:hypothetical protein